GTSICVAKQCLFGAGPLSESILIESKRRCDRRSFGENLRSRRMQEHVNRSGETTRASDGSLRDRAYTEVHVSA
ncbi:MAG: hypothetical protein WB822_07165, partial [Rhodoplanes sp.]